MNHQIIFFKEINLPFLRLQDSNCPVAPLHCDKVLSVPCTFLGVFPSKVHYTITNLLPYLIVPSRKCFPCSFFSSGLAKNGRQMMSHLLKDTLYTYPMDPKTMQTRNYNLDIEKKGLLNCGMTGFCYCL